MNIMPTYTQEQVRELLDKQHESMKIQYEVKYEKMIETLKKIQELIDFHSMSTRDSVCGHG